MKRFLKTVTTAIIKLRFALFFILFPIIKKNRIFFISMNGNSYGCNPRAITESLLEKFANKEIVIYWAFKKGFTPKNLDKRIKVVTLFSFRYFRAIVTSKVIINNQRFRVGRDFLKRKKQIYIQTWHGTALKKIEKDAENALSLGYKLNAPKDSNSWDLALSGSKYHTETLKNSFWYTGEIRETGMPRNDIFFNSEKVNSIRNSFYDKYKIPENENIVLFAPTFRNNAENNFFDLDVKELLNNIKIKFGGEWSFFIKLHPNLLNKVKAESVIISQGCRITDVTSYPDMQEILAITSVLITDYSSSIFDFMLTKRPCFLYIPDYQQYERGTYFNVEELPFPFSKDNERLNYNISTFNEEKLLSDIETFENNTLSSVEKGNASEQIAEYIISCCAKKRK